MTKKLVALCLSVAMVIAAMSGIALMTDAGESETASLGGFSWNDIGNGGGIAEPASYGPVSAYKFDKTGGGGASYNDKAVANALGLENKAEGHVVDMKVEALFFWDRRGGSDPKFQFRTFNVNGEINHEPSMSAVTGDQSGKWVVYSMDCEDVVIGKDGQDDIRLQLLDRNDENTIYLGGLRFTVTPTGGSTRSCQWGAIDSLDYSAMPLPEFSWKNEDPKSFYLDYAVLDMTMRQFSYNGGRLAKWMGLNSNDVVDLSISLSYFWDQKSAEDWLCCETIAPDGTTLPDRGKSGLAEAGMTPGSWQIHTWTREDQVLGYPGKDDWYLSFDILEGGGFYIRGLIFSAKLADGSERSVVWGTMKDRDVDYSNLELPEFSWRHDNTQLTQYDDYDAYSIVNGDFSYNKGELAKWMGLTRNDVVDVTVSFSYFWDKKSEDDVMKFETVDQDGNATPDRGAVKMTDAGMTAGSWQTYTETREDQVLGYPEKDDWYLGFDIAEGGGLYIRGMIFEVTMEDGSVRKASWGTMESRLPPPEPDERYTLTNAFWNPAEDTDTGSIYHGSIEQMAYGDDAKTYARVLPTHYRVLALADANKTLAGVSRVTFEMEYFFPAMGGGDPRNRRFRIDYRANNGEGGSYEKNSKEFVINNGEAVEGSWATFKMEVTDARFDQGMDGTDFRMVYFWGEDKMEPMYVRSLKAYATNDPSKVVSIEFTKEMLPPKVIPEDEIIVLDTMDSDGRYNGTLETNYKKQGAAAVRNSGRAGGDVSVNSHDNALKVELPQTWVDKYYFEAWIYVSKASAIGEGSCLELSQAMDSIEVQYGIREMNLHDGWNKVQIKISDMDQTAVEDMRRITKIRFFCLGLSDDLTIALDDMVLTRVPGAANDSDFGKEQVKELEAAVVAAEKVDASKASQKLKDALDVALGAAKAMDPAVSTARDVQAAAEWLKTMVKAIEEYKPIDPLGPTRPTTSTKPVDPTDPTKPTVPTVPVDPDKPTDPAKPTVSAQPTKPTSPTVPEKTAPSVEESVVTEAPTTESVPTPVETGETGVILPVALLALGASVALAAALKKREQD